MSMIPSPSLGRSLLASRASQNFFRPVSEEGATKRKNVDWPTFWNIYADTGLHPDFCYFWINDTLKGVLKCIRMLFVLLSPRALGAKNGHEPLVWGVQMPHFLLHVKPPKKNLGKPGIWFLNAKHSLLSGSSKGRIFRFRLRPRLRECGAGRAS